MNFLYCSIGLPSPPIEGLLSLCAISLVHKDKQLGELAIKELKKFEQDLNHGHHVAFLIAQFYIQNVRILSIETFFDFNNLNLLREPKLMLFRM